MARSRCWEMPCTRCCRLPRKAPEWRSRMRRCSPNASVRLLAKMPRAFRLRCKRYARLRRLARGAGPAHRAAGGANLPPHGPHGFRTRPRDQGDGPAAHAGATGLDLRLAGVRRPRDARGRPVDCFDHWTVLPERTGGRAPLTFAGGGDDAAGAAAVGAEAWHLLRCQASSANLVCPRSETYSLR